MEPIFKVENIKQAAVAGAAIDTKIDIADIREKDQILGVVNITTFAELSGEASVSNIKANGTIQCTSVVADDYVTVDGTIFKGVANPAADGLNSGRSSAGPFLFDVGANDDECAANLADAINFVAGLKEKAVTASATTDTVTVEAGVEGTVGNAIKLAESTTGARFTLSGATLANGTDTGGIELSTTATGGENLIVTWYQV